MNSGIFQKASCRFVASFLAGVCFFLVFNSRARASDPLHDWIETALDRNQEVISARRFWDASREDPAAARSLPDPMIGVELMRMENTRLDDYDTVEWMASQRLPWFGKLAARADAASLLADAAGFRYLKTRRETRAKVIAAYWNLWAAEEAVKTYRGNLELLRDFESVARQRYAAGEGSLGDVLRAEVEAARLENDLETRSRELEVAIAAVNRLLSAPPDTAREPPLSPELPELRWTLEEAKKAALDYCCVRAAYYKELQAREEMLRLARLDRAPDFQFSVAARRHRGRGGIREFDTGLALNFPWLWSGKYRAGLRRARAERKRAEARLANETDMLLLEVIEHHTRAETSSRTVKLFEEVLLPRAGELVESARAAYESGRSGFLELIEAQKVLLSTELDYHRSRARLAGEIARLEADIAPWDEEELATGLIE